MTTRREAVDGLKQLGLSTYEAKTFIALQQLGSGTARDVADVTDVPRSQVYGAAESLAEMDLVEIQEADPRRYRPVGVEAAESRLRERMASTREQAFEYIENTRAELAVESEQREELWTVTGRDSIDRRTRSLLAEAESMVLVGVDDPDVLVPTTVSDLLELARDGIRIVVVSDDATVRAQFADTPVVTGGSTVPETVGERTGRLLVVDSDTVLLSVVDEHTGTETAIWSSGTSFAVVLVQLIESFVPAIVDDSTDH